jgi:hypothetical protein
MKPKEKFKDFFKSSGARMYQTKSGGAGVHEDKKRKKLEKLNKKEDRDY